MDNFAKMSTTHATFAMTSPCIQGGRTCAPPLYPGNSHGNFAWVVEILAKLSMRATAVHTNYHATHAQRNSAMEKLGNDAFSICCVFCCFKESKNIPSANTHSFTKLGRLRQTKRIRLGLHNSFDYVFRLRIAVR
jgi:hypothetical protein